MIVGSIALALLVLIAWAGLGVLGLYLMMGNVEDQEEDDDISDRRE